MSRETIKLLSVILLALALRAYLMTGHDLWQVEAQNAWLSRASLPEIITTLEESGVRPPLHLTLLKAWGSVSGHETWLRLLSLALSTLAVLAVYRAASTLFCRRTGAVAAGLCAASPLLATSAGSLVAPYALDVLLCGLILLTFLGLLAGRTRRAWLTHGLVLAAGAYANPALLGLAAAEALFLAFFFRRAILLWRRWAMGAALAIFLFLPWMPVTRVQVHRPFGHDELITESTGLRMSCLLTEISLGRLYAWYPLTPVVSLLPPAVEGEELGMRRPDPADEDALAGWLQVMQMFHLGCFGMLALVGVFAAMKLSAWPVPVYLRIKLARQKAGQGDPKALAGADQPLLDSPRQGAALVLIYLLVPLALPLGARLFLGWPFEGSELTFIALPYLILAARGLGAIEWRPMHHAAVAFFLVACALFAVVSRGLDGLTDGTESIARSVEEDFDYSGADAVLHANPLTYFPVLYYSGGRLDAATFIAGEEGPAAWGDAAPKDGVLIGGVEGLSSFERVWWIEVEPKAGSIFAETLDYWKALSRYRGEEPPLPFDPLPDWTREKSVRFKNVAATLYRLR